MPELLLELFCEEIPARMQARAAEDLSRMFAERCAALIEAPAVTFHGPRRIGLSVLLRDAVTTEGREERGPRVGAPEQALDGFVRKHGVARDALTQEGAFWVLVKPGETVQARALVAAAVPAIIRAFPWPKSMRWGGSSAMTWVRPLKRILCVLDGAVVPFDLRAGDDDGHGLVSGDLTEGHRMMAPGVFAVRGLADYAEGLRERRVVLDATERARLIREGIDALCAAEGLAVVPDEALVTEVAGLVEWPVPLLGRIDDAFMDLPPEVMRTTMRVNQRYFALRNADGSAAARFALVANVAAPDGGAAIVAGNERVLRARLSDARFFWDLDRKQRLEDFLPKLDSVVFHKKLGTQGQRVARLERLAALIAEKVGADPVLAARAAKLAKADLASGMVGEFPELQGVMGRYYALGQGEKAEVAEAIGAHYRPAGPGDEAPSEPIAIAVALADKVDQIVGFLRHDLKPTGSSDPFALRRAALGIIRIIRESRLRLSLGRVLESANYAHSGQSISRRFEQAEALKKELENVTGISDRDHPMVTDNGEDDPPDHLVAADVLDFLLDRLRVQLRAEGTRHDVVTAVLGATPDDDLNRLLARAAAVRVFVESDAGANLLAAYKRAANILRIEEKRDGHTFDTGYAHDLLKAREEDALATALEAAATRIETDLAAEAFEPAMDAMATLRTPVDAFFDKVIVNDADAAIRENRLKLLARLRATMDAVADFSKIEA